MSGTFGSGWSRLPGCRWRFSRLGEDGQPALLSEAETDADGRVRALLRDDLQPGSDQLVFDVAAYLHDEAEFFENMAVGFRVDDPKPKNMMFPAAALAVRPVH